MMYLQSLKRSATLAAIGLFSCAGAQQSAGIIGGQDSSGAAYAAFISPSGTPSVLTPLPANSTIKSVDMNLLGQGIIGGEGPGTVTYAAIVSPSGVATAITPLPANGPIKSVAINFSGQAIIGGQGPGSAAYAALVSPSGISTAITPLPLNGAINNVAINVFGQGIIGGQDNSMVNPTPYAAFVFPTGIQTPITPLPATGIIFSVAVNDSGQGIIGGENVSSPFPAFVALVSPSGIATSVTTGINGLIRSVAINASGQGIVGGQSIILTDYAALVSSSGTATLITPLPHSGIITSVAINDAGQAIIGGQVNSHGLAYAAFVSPSGVATPINISISNGVINAVAINNFGQGLIGGQVTGGPAYAAIISSSGIETPINLNQFSGDILSVALPLLYGIPTGSLNGNNLIFANYINKYAPQDAFYFVPAYFDGTLADALESAAPTRNAASLYTAGKNLFYLMTGLSNHLHDRSMKIRTKVKMPQASVALGAKSWKSEDELLASISLQPSEQSIEQPSEQPLVQSTEQPSDQPEEEYFEMEERSNSVWFEAIGALAYQKVQHQTPGFNPTTGGAILAYDGKVSEHTRVGVGADYLFTHVHEKKDAGHSHINQEDLFVYSTWENKDVYVDLSILGGFFQISQVRKIHMTGFEFKSTSHPHGWQLLPHVELGYHYTRPQGVELTFNPFIMVDWANAWQHSYKEKGSGPFNAGQKSHYSSLVRTEVSLRMYETVFFNAWNLIFQEKAGYVNVHSFRTGNVNAFLVGSPGSFTVTTLTSPQNLGVAEFAMIFAPHSSGYPTGTIFYQGEFGVQYQSHQVAIELAWNF